VYKFIVRLFGLFHVKGRCDDAAQLMQVGTTFSD